MSADRNESPFRDRARSTDRPLYNPTIRVSWEHSCRILVSYRKYPRILFKRNPSVLRNSERDTGNNLALHVANDLAADETLSQKGKQRAERFFAA